MIRCVSVLLLVAGTLAASQIVDKDYKLSVDVELVQLPVSVFDARGIPVRDLRQEQFAVYEDKVLQNILLFKQEDVPLSVGLVVDASVSMLDKLDRLHAAALTFVRESNPEDETSIFSFGDEVVLEQDFTNNVSDLRRALEATPLSESTAFYDAIFLAAKQVQARGSRDKKVMLVITDGEDNRSKYSLRQALKALSESKVIVYTVGLLGRDTPPYAMRTETAMRALKQIAEVSGGAYFFPNSADEVQEICQKIARDLRNQYTIGYRPSNRSLDGSWRKVAVQLNLPEKSPSLTLRTKQGYYAPKTRVRTSN
jgi:Ca-activated chloride channel homolog